MDRWCNDEFDCEREECEWCEGMREVEALTAEFYAKKYLLALIERRKPPETVKARQATALYNQQWIDEPIKGFELSDIAGKCPCGKTNPYALESTIRHIVRSNVICARCNDEFAPRTKYKPRYDGLSSEEIEQLR